VSRGGTSKTDKPAEAEALAARCGVLLEEGQFPPPGGESSAVPWPLFRCAVRETPKIFIKLRPLPVRREGPQLYGS